jgi:hypothetical protein
MFTLSQIDKTTDRKNEAKRKLIPKNKKIAA